MIFLRFLLLSEDRGRGGGRSVNASPVVRRDAHPSARRDDFSPPLLALHRANGALPVRHRPAAWPLASRRGFEPARLKVAHVPQPVIVPTVEPRGGTPGPRVANPTGKVPLAGASCEAAAGAAPADAGQDPVSATLRKESAPRNNASSAPLRGRGCELMMGAVWRAGISFFEGRIGCHWPLITALTPMRAILLVKIAGCLKALQKRRVALKLSRVVVKNYRSLALLDVALDETSTLVIGENSTGKSSLLYALRLCLDVQLFSAYRALQKDDIHASVDPSKPFQVLVGVEFSDFEGIDNKEALLHGSQIGENRACLFLSIPSKAIG